MKTKKENKKIKNNWMRNKFLLIGILGILLISSVVIISALTSDEQTVLQNELESLESNLTNSGYSWLVNYSTGLIINAGEII